MMLYPVNLQIAGKSCLVVGGGNVSLRKIRSLLACGGRVTVISPEVVSGIHQLAEEGAVTLLQRGYQAGDLADAFLVFAVTDNPRVQELVAAEAEERGVLLNSADNPGRCDFQVPAKVRRGDLLLTVSTGGASPALSKLIREQLEDQFDDEYGTVVSLFAGIREIVVDGSGNAAANRDLFQRLLNAGLHNLVCQRNWDAVASILAAELPGQPDIGALIEASRNR